MAYVITARNDGTDTITIEDRGGYEILGGETHTLTEVFEPYELSESNDILPPIADGSLVIGNGTDELPPSEGIKWVTVQNTIEGPKDRSNKLRVHATPRQLGLSTYFMSAGDDRDDVLDVGGGDPLAFYHESGDSTTLTMVKYVDLNIAENETWIYEGYIFYKDTQFDTISFEIVPEVTAVTGGADTYYNLYGGYLIVPAAGDGTISLVNDMTDPRHGLVRMPLNDLGQRQLAYWNADYNSTTHEFENLSAAPAGDGNYNMFTAEITLTRFVNKLCLVGGGVTRLDSYDTDELGQGMRLRATTVTGPTDHTWALSFGLTFFRESSS